MPLCLFEYKNYCLQAIVAALKDEPPFVVVSASVTAAIASNHVKLPEQFISTQSHDHHRIKSKCVMRCLEYFVSW